MKPSLFTDLPYGSVLQKTEAEIVARNIMQILSRTGNEFRSLTWNEYESERLKDGEFSAYEKKYFDQVLPYCKDADRASMFSSVWKDAYVKYLKSEGCQLVETESFSRKKVLEILKDYDREFKLDTHAYTKACSFTVEEWFNKKVK